MASAQEPASPFVRFDHRLSGTGIDADAGGAWAVVNGSIARIDLDGHATSVASGKWFGEADLIALEGGNFLVRHSSSHSVRKVGAVGDEPVMLDAVQYALGPDGALYAMTYRNATSLLRLEPGSRTVTPFAALPDGIRDIAFSPSGELFVLAGRNVSRYDASTGAFESVHSAQSWPHTIAFDAQGRLYFVEEVQPRTWNWSMSLVRVDLGTGEAAHLLDLGQVRVLNLAFGGTRLYMMHETREAGRLVHSLGYVDLGVQGFEGFTGALPLPPAGDLAVTSVHVERGERLPVLGLRNDVNEVRTIVVTVTNVGPGTVEGRWGGYVSVAPASPLAIVTGIGQVRGWGIAHAAPMQSGESVTFRIPWDVTRYAGELSVRVDIDELSRVLELDERGNNWATTTTVVRTTL